MPIQLESFKRIIPMIYAYTTPEIARHDGWVKIGYTDKQTVEERIHQQTHTVNVRAELAWSDNAMYKDGSGEYFHDTDFHRFLTSTKKVKREPKTEWFEVTGPVSEKYFGEFAKRKYHFADTGSEYVLRREQAEAVRMTADYYRGGGDEFLWNCKPRFGKTLSAYDLVRTMGFRHVLVVTNRPSIANSWAEDFKTFIGWREPRTLFVSDCDALSGTDGVLTREQYTDYCIRNDGEDVPYICFESLQNIKGSAFMGGNFDKLKWITEMEFDLLIVDESHEGVDTKRTSRAFKEISRKHTLYLSGTPFKQLADGCFSRDQIYNWTYADEQEAKESWTADGMNPYERLPRLSMFTYQISPMLTDRLQQPIDFSEEGYENFAFDLNEFFATKENRTKREEAAETATFVHEEEVKKFLHALCTQEKYPFSTPELRKELAHTMWYMDRIDGVLAMRRLLESDPVFSEYHVVVAAGNVRENNDFSENEDQKQSRAFDLVKQAVATYEKTITLTVGQLTVGVTIPEWSGVLMLCNLKSPSAYMQAAFRAQNPCSFTSPDGVRYQKENAYVFDFDPARTLVIYDQFANDLMGDTASGGGTEEERQKNIKRLLNFFPVLGEDDEGRMVELDAAKVLSIPRRLKSCEVVRRGFMSNLLFVNLSNIFGAPQEIKEIINKLTPAQEEPKRKRGDLPDEPEIPMDEEGNIDFPTEIIIGRSQDVFGDKLYETIPAVVAEPIRETIASITERMPQDQVTQAIADCKEKIKSGLSEVVVPALSERYSMNKAQERKAVNSVATTVNSTFESIEDDYRQKTKVAQLEYKNNTENAETEEERRAADEKWALDLQKIIDETKTKLENVSKDISQDVPRQLVKEQETRKAETEKKNYCDEFRAHLRGFFRSIPSFLMAYGDRNLTLANLDTYVEDSVFEEVTGISKEEFRQIRDGVEVLDEETGEKGRFQGHYIDEKLFADSVQEFLNRKEVLSNYFDEDQTEDIFDYIPPQKTNQIFTPRAVVEKMADLLEENHPGCFDDPNYTFADLYMKSGLYITEIVKRLYRSEKMKALYPDDKARIRHILEKQVYGLAPTRIIYLIATNYILGFDEDIRESVQGHFAEGDAAAAAKQGKLAELAEKAFGAVSN